MADHWRTENLRDAQPGRDPRRWLKRGVTASTSLTIALMLVNLNRDATRCDQDCFGTYRTFQPGYAWTNYPGSWQWEAQNVLAALAFGVSVAAFGFLLASRWRRAKELTAASLALGAAWVAWVALSPPIGS